MSALWDGAKELKMRFFEIIIVFRDDESNKKTHRQYFYVKKNDYFIAIEKVLLHVSYMLRKLGDNHYLERFLSFEWKIETPKTDGSLDSKKLPEKLIHWSNENGLECTHKGLSQNQKYKIANIIKNSIRTKPLHTVVQIEEINGKMNDDVKKYWTFAHAPL